MQDLIEPTSEHAYVQAMVPVGATNKGVTGKGGSSFFQFPDFLDFGGIWGRCMILGVWEDFGFFKCLFYLGKMVLGSQTHCNWSTFGGSKLQPRIRFGIENPSQMTRLPMMTGFG